LEVSIRRRSKNELVIDGSFGEGGGQIIRTAVALSSVTLRPIRIFNIRTKRKNPGFAAQHLNSIRSAGMMTDADLGGVELRSKEMTFHPKKNEGGKFNVEIGTAGSISLVLQCIMPVAVFAKDMVEMSITGGTDVAWSPPIDFLRFVLLPTLSSMGVRAEIELIRRGYYPEGGGLVKAMIHPSRLGRMESESRKDDMIRGISHSSRLPESVAVRQADTARRILREDGYEVSVDLERSDHPSTGSGITLWSGCKSGSSLGARGKPAEKVGEEAAKMILAELNSDSTVDLYLSDQLLPYMALSHTRNEMIVRELTEHARTNVWVIERFFDAGFEIKEDGLTEIRVKGAAYC
jgi:RNA 3'-terminal phosphate cyclase (ATP)